MTARTAPVGTVMCVSGGRCGEMRGWHYIGSQAHQRCQRLQEAAQQADTFRDALAKLPETPGGGRSLGLRKMSPAEIDVLESLRTMALRFMPFYSHLLYKVRPVAVDEPPSIGPNGEPIWMTRAAITRDWRLIVNFDWVRHEYESAYEQHAEHIRSQLKNSNKPVSDAAVREGCDMYASFALCKVVLHEMGHAMFNSWDYVEKNKLDFDLWNRAEDAVINNSLRVLGSRNPESIPNENIHGEFLPNAVYGGSIPCDDPAHSWHYTDPETGETSSRCDYDQSIMHYYQAIQAAREEQQKSHQGSTGDKQPDDDAPEAAKGNNTGERKGAEGGSDRASETGADGSTASEPGPSEGAGSDDDSSAGSGGDSGGAGDGSPSGPQSGQAGSHAGHSRGQAGSHGDHSRGQAGSHADHSHGDDACGRSAAERYDDDPLEKGVVSEAEQRVARDVTASALEEWAEQNEEAAKAIGLGSGSMMRQWAKHRRRTDNIRWDRLLNRNVRRTIESLKTTRQTYAAANRRTTGGLGVIRRGSKPGDMPSIATAIDTSGSMSAEDLFMAYNSVHNIIRRTGVTSVQAFAVDAEPKSMPTKIKKAEDLQHLLSGGGGTDMCAGIEVAAKNGNDVCIVLTDGEVPWDKMAERPRDIPTMEVIVGVIAEKDDLLRLTENVPSWMKAVPIDKSLLSGKGAAGGQEDYFG